MRLPWMSRAGLIVAASLWACDGAKDDGSTDDTDVPVELGSAFDQIGGEGALHDVIDRFVQRVGANATVNWMFANSDLDALNASLYDQTCQALGGPCTYSGRSMAEVHADMAITESQWAATMEEMVQAINDTVEAYITDQRKDAGAALRVSAQFDGSKPMDALIVAMASMHDDIVVDANEDSVYFNRLGGINGVRGVISGMLTYVGADARINSFFASTDLGALNDLLVEQVCEATGGYCTYSGRSMLETHQGLCISDADFDALVEDLILAINDAARYDPAVDPPEDAPYSPELDGSRLFDVLLTVLAGMRGDIVESCPT